MSEKVELDGDGVPLEAEGFSEKEKAANRPGETGTEKADSGTGAGETGTEKADSETGAGDEGQRPGSLATPNPAQGEEARQPKTDWVEEAYKCFIKNAGDIDPTDPVKAVEAYFRKNATDELKARCKAEGKDAKGCWKFVEAVARKALHGSSGHIDPGVVYAIAMHWFEDVPKNWDKVERSSTIRTASQIRKEKAKAKAAKKRKSKTQQGFFFEMLETPVEGGTEK